MVVYTSGTGSGFASPNGFGTGGAIYEYIAQPDRYVPALCVPEPIGLFRQPGRNCTAWLLPILGQLRTGYQGLKSQVMQFLLMRFTSGFT